MIIAIPYQEGYIFQHFGKTSQFYFYNTETKEYCVKDTNGAGHSALVGYLQENQTNVLLCGGIGQGALNALQAANIHVYAGNDMSCADALEAYLNQTLVQNTVASCSHHGHDTCK